MLCFERAFCRGCKSINGLGTLCVLLREQAVRREVRGCRLVTLTATLRPCWRQMAAPWYELGPEPPREFEFVLRAGADLTGLGRPSRGDAVGLRVELAAVHGAAAGDEEPQPGRAVPGAGAQPPGAGGRGAARRCGRTLHLALYIAPGPRRRRRTTASTAAATRSRPSRRASPERAERRALVAAGLCTSRGAVTRAAPAGAPLRRAPVGGATGGAHRPGHLPDIWRQVRGPRVPVHWGTAARAADSRARRGSANDEVAAFGNGLTLAVASAPLAGSSARPMPMSAFSVARALCSPGLTALRFRSRRSSQSPAQHTAHDLWLLLGSSSERGLPRSLRDRQRVGRAPQPGGHVRDLPDRAHVLAARRAVLRGAAAGRRLRGAHRGARPRALAGQARQGSLLGAA